MLHGFRSPIYSSWPGRSAKRVFALDAPAIHVFCRDVIQDVDARHKAWHDDNYRDHALPRSSRKRSSFCCTGRSEKLNRTESSSASWVTHCQLGTTKDRKSTRLNSS